MSKDCYFGVFYYEDKEIVEALSIKLGLKRSKHFDEQCQKVNTKLQTMLDGFGLFKDEDDETDALHLVLGIECNSKPLSFFNEKAQVLRQCLSRLDITEEPVVCVLDYHS